MPDPTLATQANDGNFVYARATSCWKSTGRNPNFIYVDWYGFGDAIDAVRRVNALPRPGDP